MSTMDLLSLIDKELSPSASSDNMREYDLHLVGGSEWLVSKVGRIDALEHNKTGRVIVANLTRGRLQAVRRGLRYKLVSFDQCADGLQLEDGLTLLRRFARVRDLAQAPFFAALSFSTEKHSQEIRVDGSDFSERDFHNFEVRINAVGESEDLRLSSPLLEPDDLRLIDIWRTGRMREQTGERSPRHERFSLLSLGYARLAEKLVLRYLTAQRQDAQDVSLGQLDGTNALWKSCDIVADRHIDVKNATTYGSRKRHVFVPKFKKVDADDVLIAGVISEPYSEFVEYRRRKKKYMGGHYVYSVRQTFLGFASLTDIDSVQAAINGLPERRQALALSFYENMLSAWTFEASVGIDTIKLLHVAELFAHELTTIIAASLACGHPVEEAILTGLNPAQRQLFEQFRFAVEKAGYSKATIALFAISEFIAWSIDGRNSAALIRFLRKINTIEDFTNTRDRLGFGLRSGREDEKYETNIEFSGNCCGGLYDPTDSICTLFNLLETCAEQIGRLGARFVYFDVPNQFILVGKDEQGRATTLYAYCGGKLDNGAWCNHFPLVIGENASCPSCLRLVCNECGYCASRCPELPKRKATRHSPSEF
jgi:hypothetical protein